MYVKGKNWSKIFRPGNPSCHFGNTFIDILICIQKREQLLKKPKSVGKVHVIVAFNNISFNITECYPGFYGSACIQCSEHCISRECDTASGDCLQGCEPGYDFNRNPMCNTRKQI